MSLDKLVVRHDEKANTLKVQWVQGGNVTDDADPVPFENPLTTADSSDLRWYLEEYPRFPIGIYPDRARRVEERMRD